MKVKWYDWYGPYETAVIFEYDGDKEIHIIEGYQTEEECIRGHEKYLNMPKEEFDKLKFIG